MPCGFPASRCHCGRLVVTTSCVPVKAVTAFLSAWGWLSSTGLDVALERLVGFTPEVARPGVASPPLRLQGLRKGFPVPSGEAGVFSRDIPSPPADSLDSPLMLSSALGFPAGTQVCPRPLSPCSPLAAGWLGCAGNAGCVQADLGQTGGWDTALPQVTEKPGSPVASLLPLLALPSFREG